MIIVWSVIVIFLLSRFDLIWSKPIQSVQKLLSSTRTRFEVPKIVASTDKVIIVQDVAMAYVPKVLYELDFQAALASFEFDYEEKLLFFSTYNEIYRKDLTTEHVQKIFPESGNTSAKFDMINFSLDWLNNDLYFLADLKGYKTFNIYKITFDGKKQDVVYSTHSSRIECFQVDPYNGFLFWTNGLGMNRADLIDVRNTMKLIYLERDLGSFVIDYVNYHTYIIHDRNDYLISMSLDGSQREVVHANALRAGFHNAPSLALLYNKFYWTDNSEVMFEEYDKKTKKYSHNQLFIHCSSCTFFSYVLAYSAERQPVPYPLSPPVDIRATNVTESTIHLSWKKPILTDGKGKGAWRKYFYKVQSVNLNTTYTQIADNIMSTSYTLDNGLARNCTYEIKVLAYTATGQSLWSNGIIVRASPFIYSDLLSNAVKELTPKHVKVDNLTPTMIKIKWLPPTLSKFERIWYEINWKNNQSEVDVKQKIVVDNSMRFENNYIISKLHVSPNQIYYLWIRAHRLDKKLYSDSDVIKIKTYRKPNSLELVKRTDVTLVLKWFKSNEIVDFTFEYAVISNLDWIPIGKDNVTSKTREDAVTITVNNLKPKSKYQFRIKLSYLKTVNNQFIWPKKEPYYIFETLAGVPAESPAPIARKTDQTYFIEWSETVEHNGSPIQYYLVEAFNVKKTSGKTLTVVCNTTQLHCAVKDLPESGVYRFRVKACNAVGVADYGVFTNIVLEPKPVPQAVGEEFVFTPTHYYLHIVVVAAVMSTMVAIYLSIQLYKDYSSPVSETANLVTFSTQQTSTNNAAISPAATVIEPEENVVVNRNSLPTPSQDEINKLPQFNQNDLILIQLLGQGAFGDVYIGETSKKQRVAVKTLRSDIDARKRDSFFNEAILMSKFQHQHVLQFLGICLVEQRTYIVMELMENGDLLTYLRDSRSKNGFSYPFVNHGTKLSALDMTNMCIQICLGCQYLERKKYIHRDLACRNCLVAVRDQEVLVKIADFGLTRKIEDKNYYRVQNETMLPVRWMAPESLNNSIYTTQSDVWAFGVVMWEIFTVGDEPYSRMDVLEVIEYVKSGSTLWSPSNCPVDVCRLMKRCWQYNYRNRVSFKSCLDELSLLKASLMGHHYENLNGCENDYLAVIPDNHRKLKISTIENKTYLLGSKLSMPSNMPIISEEP